MISIGIDPGRKGAAVALSSSLEVLDVLELPYDGRDLDVGEFRGWMNNIGFWVNGAHPRIILEAVSTRPRQNPGAVLSMGKNWGRLHAVVQGLGVPYRIVRPQEWQKVVCKGEDRKGTDTKTRTIKVVKAELPGLDLTPGKRRKPHDGIADAAGMALYGLHHWRS